MKVHIARVSAFWLLIFSLTSLTLAQTSGQTAAAPSAEGLTPAVSGTGTTNFVPLWTNSSGVLGNSVLFQSGTGTAAKIGVNTTAPAATLDVNGGANIRGTLNLASAGIGSATGGKNSVALDFTASVFNSGSATAVPQKFFFQAEPVNNDTASPSAALSLLFSANNATPTETGLKISSKGIITFAPGQNFAAGGSFCIAVDGGFGGGGTTFAAPSLTVPAQNSCSQWSGYTKTASTVILSTSGSACLSSTGKTLTVSVTSADPSFLPTGTTAGDYIQLTRASGSGTFTGGSDQGEFSGAAKQATCTTNVLSLPDIHD